MFHFRRHTVLEQGSLIRGRAAFNSEKRMFKLISRFVNIAFELAFELKYYNDKDCQRPFYSFYKECAKDEIIHGNFKYFSLIGEGFIRYMRAIALVAHQCCMYKLHTCELLFGAMIHPFSFTDIHNSFASAFEKLNGRESADKAIFYEMDKLARIVSEYDDINTVNYEQSFITFLIYNYTKSLDFDIF